MPLPLVPLLPRLCLSLAHSLSCLCTNAWPVLHSWRVHPSIPRLPLNSPFPGNLAYIYHPKRGRGLLITYIAVAGSGCRLQARHRASANINNCQATQWCFICGASQQGIADKVSVLPIGV